MEYKRLGNSGLKVSEICLGTMTFGHGADEVESTRMVHLAWDAGVNFFNTANSYGEGESEKILGLEKLNSISHLPDRYPEAMEKNMHERRDSAVEMPLRLS